MNASEVMAVMQTDKAHYGAAVPGFNKDVLERWQRPEVVLCPLHPLKGQELPMRSHFNA